MTAEELHRALSRCVAMLRAAGYVPVQNDGKTSRAMLERAHWCAQEALGFLATDQGKAMRWLGFCQGVLYTQANLTIDDLREMSKSLGPGATMDGGLRRAVTSLLWGVVANAGHDPRPKVATYRWALVMAAVGCGSTVAKNLCEEHGFDPDEMIGGPLPGDEEE